MQRQHSSQATFTLGNTPNLIGSYDKKHYIDSQTKETLYCFGGKLYLIAMNDKYFFPIVFTIFAFIHCVARYFSIPATSSQIY